jgi:hypothetical protein
MGEKNKKKKKKKRKVSNLTVREWMPLVGV